MKNKKQIYSAICPRCNGKGKYYSHEFRMRITCEYKDCKGKGWISVEE
jgi:DnaJ-class molecular chaperone